MFEQAFKNIDDVLWKEAGCATELDYTEQTSWLSPKQQVFLDFVLSQYVKIGVEELDREKLSPLLKLKYNNAIADAVADLGRPEELGNVFAGFQKHLYQEAA